MPTPQQDGPLPPRLAQAGEDYLAFDYSAIDFSTFSKTELYAEANAILAAQRAVPTASTRATVAVKQEMAAYSAVVLCRVMEVASPPPTRLIGLESGPVGAERESVYIKQERAVR